MSTAPPPGESNPTERGAETTLSPLASTVPHDPMAPSTQLTDEAAGPSACPKAGVRGRYGESRSQESSVILTPSNDALCSSPDRLPPPSTALPQPGIT